MRRACIDIGSNTTRLLVADCGQGRLVPVEQARAFTSLGANLAREGRIGTAKIREVAEAVSDQLAQARALGATDVRAVATAAIRRAHDGGDLVDAIHRDCGMRVRVLDAQQEGRLAFLGAAGTLGHAVSGGLGVVDVGGGSSELVVGEPPDDVRWSVSIPIGSGDLAALWPDNDPPSPQQLGDAERRVAALLEGVEAPHPSEAVAVGGSATSLRRLAGPALDREALERSLRLLAAERAAAVADRFGLALERVRLLPGALLILRAAGELLGGSLGIGGGGVREGVLLEASR